MFVYISSIVIVIVVTQKLVLQQSKNVTTKCRKNLSPPPCILFSLNEMIVEQTEGMQSNRILVNIGIGSERGFKM